MTRRESKLYEQVAQIRLTPTPPSIYTEGLNRNSFSPADQEENNLDLVYRLFLIICFHQLEVNGCSFTAPIKGSPVLKSNGGPLPHGHDFKCPWLFGLRDS